jgi:hypothetical protein
MPSDQGTVEQVLEVVAGPMERFQSALVRSVEDVRAFLASHRAPTADYSTEVAAQLGAFGSGRIDPDRFADLLRVDETLDPERLHRVEKALSHLETLESSGTELYRTRVAPNGDLRDTVAQALARIGSAFGMIRVVASARDERSEPLDPEDFAGGFPLSRWGRSERRLAPPLVVEVEGSDLTVGGLAEFLDGGLEIVLVVQGPAPPAALARLISPDVFVIQTPDPADLAGAMEFEGPVMAAVVCDGGARFVHDPGAGSDYAARLTVNEVPDVADLAPVGSASVFRQRQDLEHLLALTTAGAEATWPEAEVGGEPAAAPAPGAEAATPADRLAGWLIQQARLEAVD